MTASETIADLLGRQAGSRPRRPALTAPGRASVTYGELERTVAAARLAWAGLGFTRTDRMAVALPNGMDLAVTLLSVMGVATAVPVDLDGPPAELVRHLRGSRATALVVRDTAGNAAARAAETLGLPVIEVLPTGPAPRAGLQGGNPREHAHEPPRAADAALLLRTSGTTGEPKFVAISHARLCLSARNIASGLELTEDDRCLNVMPLSHAHGLLTPLLATLSAGGQVDCLPGFDADGFFAAMSRCKPTWYSAVPTIHQEILARAGGQREVIGATTLRFVRSASAPLPAHVRDRLAETFRAPVIESYGMTETTSVVASNPLPPRARKPGSVGLPAGCEVAVLDGNGHPAPVGQVGEIVVRGPAVADGYDHDREATATAFVDGWFHTGDLGRFDEDGYLYLAGRTKETINRGGLTVSPFEIEQVLQSHPAVAQAVVFPLPHPTLGEDIGVAVVPAEDAQPTEREIRAYAAQHLSPALIPSRVVLVGQIPHGAHGKVQRRELHTRLPLPPVGFAPPRTQVQRTLVAIWQDLLGRERIGVHDNFFDLGGDSLRAVPLAEAITRHTGVPVNVVDIFAFPTVASQAELVDTGRTHTPAPDGAAGSADPDGAAVRAGLARLARRRGRGGGNG
ncbi:AMP-binding protein [Paractinoplanes rhizophilus]|jgi:acyl-CoA synthetase (AMP-forming)/AMP-acid ligase II/aryl carrier-like protein|uniref:AMP-binding protein n=1 Tax=Paractinoplanes rhizophilus TaxID=1416877 RepID=A0ABW2HXG8_9ACTN|nr:non-ribosomal peptide synthetase [Actinoplanes sp.]